MKIVDTRIPNTDSLSISLEIGVYHRSNFPRAKERAIRRCDYRWRGEIWHRFRDNGASAIARSKGKLCPVGYLS